MTIKFRTGMTKREVLHAYLILVRTINLVIKKLKRDNSYKLLEEEILISNIQASRSPLRGQKIAPRPNIFKLYDR